ncbi:MAG: LysM peptidoglycan-binding domain-containing protein [Chloroflexi bacterium]|nr:LysM peptidoglycan-binding domain-containing protein [Chloroflexota bacterium]
MKMDQRLFRIIAGALFSVATVATATYLANAQPLNYTCPTTHTVRQNDTLYRIGQIYDLNWSHVAVANGISDPTTLQVGDVLNIPCQLAPAQPQQVAYVSGFSQTCLTYVVQSGDSLSRIGAALQVPWQNIAQANGISFPWLIFPGQVLTVSCELNEPVPGDSTPVESPTDSNDPLDAAESVLLAGCAIGDGNACYGPGQSCFAEFEWVRGKEYCIARGLGSNSSVQGAPVQGKGGTVYGGQRLRIGEAGDVLGTSMECSIIRVKEPSGRPMIFGATFTGSGVNSVAEDMFDSDLVNCSDGIVFYTYGRDSGLEGKYRINREDLGNLP